MSCLGSTLVPGGVTGRARKYLAQWLYRLSCRIEPRPDEEDPWSWEVSIVKVAARAESRDVALKAVDNVIRRLDVRTVHLVLILLAADLAHSRSLRDGVETWAWDRQFDLLVVRLRGDD